MFAAVIHHTDSLGDQPAEFAVSLGAGLVGAAAGTVLLWLLLCKLRLSEVLRDCGRLATDVVVAAACDIAREDSGLIAAIIMGPVVVHLPGFVRLGRRPISETLVQLIIGLLFVAISATVTPASLRHVVLPTLGLVAVLVLVTRRLAAWLATLGTDLPGGERGFIAWMAPRGIVAAASAPTFSARRQRLDRKDTVPAPFAPRSAGETTTIEGPGIPDSVADCRFGFVSFSPSVPFGSSVRQGRSRQAEFPSSGAIGAFQTLFAEGDGGPSPHPYDHKP